MKAKINGINIDYNFYPVEESPTVVFVHGFPFNQKMWQPQVEVLKGKCSILTYDGRGLGQSEVGDGQFMFENLVDDFIELLRSLKIETVIACGLSMGGYIILRAYEKQPKMFHALILCDTRAEADGNEAKLKRAQMLHILKFHGKGEILDAFEKFNYDHGIGPGVYDIHSPRVPPVEEMLEIAERSIKVIDKNLIWINPDCGLKTRNWEEVIPSLQNLVQVARIMRDKYAD